LLQCAGCNHKWFFKKEIPENTVASLIVETNEDNSINFFDQDNPINRKEINASID